jgi:hypothetical protein
MKNKISGEAVAPANVRPSSVQKMIARFSCLNFGGSRKNTVPGFTTRQRWQLEYSSNRMIEQMQSGRGK